MRGDRAIQLLAGLAVEVVHELMGPDGFVGHVGGDDFIAIVGPEVAERAARDLAARFDHLAPLLYDQGDADRGFIRVEDRRGTPTRFPVLSVSIGVASTEMGPFRHYLDSVEVATEMKAMAKRETGSSFALDRRSPA